MLNALIIYVFLKLYLIINIYQQAHYQFKAYLKHFFINLFFYDFLPLCILIVGLFSNLKVVSVICSVYLVLYSLFYLICRVKLKFTKRVFRLVILNLFFIIGLYYLPYANVFLFLFYEYSVLLVLVLERFLSYIFNQKYLKKAKNKMKDFNNNIICITGSCGKTSTKMLLDQALNLYSKSICSQKSYNTELGIAKFINDSNIFLYDNLIFEFGASHVNDIKRLKRLVKANVAFVTDIGYMHVDTFGSFENIISEKMSIINDAEVAVLNYDCKEIREYLKPEGLRIISYGLNYGDYLAKNINNGSFDFYYKDYLICRFDTNFIGEHQILNLCGIIAYLYEEGYNLQLLKRAILCFKLPNNRLEVKKINNMIILDDSFNSNYKGFIEALNVLKGLEGKKVVLTPGMVELGKYKKELFNNLAKYLVSSADVIILIGYFQTKELYKILKDYNKELYLVRNFMEGYRLFMSMQNSKGKYNLLIENDLPDLYRVGLF